MGIEKQFIYNSKQPVLLVCDYYEDEQIPKCIYEIRDNISLFPVGNIPIIDLILHNLSSQNLRDIIIAGKKIDSIINHIKKEKNFTDLNIIYHHSSGNTFGDLMREIDEMRLDISSFLVLFGNHYTNIPLQILLEKYRNSEKTLMYLYLYGSSSNSLKKHMYGEYKRTLLFYEENRGEIRDHEEFRTCIEKTPCLSIFSECSSPSIAVIGAQVLPIFSENFDYHTFGDLVRGVLLQDMYDYRVGILFNTDIATEMGNKINNDVKDSKDVFTEKDNEWILPQLHDDREIDRNYSCEIRTILDYYKFTKDVGMNSEWIVFPGKSLKGFKIDETVDGYRVNNSCVDDNTKIGGDVLNCIVWDNCDILNPQKNVFIASNDIQIDIFHLESNNSVDVEKKTEETEPENIFSDIYDLLKSSYEPLVEGYITEGEVYKQLTLLRIVWNATKEEIIEGLGYFFVESIEIDELEKSLNRTLVHINILRLFIEERKDGEHLMESIYNELEEYGKELKAQILFNYGYVFVQSGIIGKSVVKKYNKLYHTGKF